MKLGASLTGVTVITNVCAGEMSTPPLAVPPSSLSVSVIVAVPLALAPGVNVKAPAEETVGPTLNKLGFVLLVTLNVNA